MDVLFADEKARQSFSRLESLRRNYGEVGAKRIALRLQQLSAAPTLADMRGMPGRCHALASDRTGDFAVDVHQPYRLIFRPEPPLDDSGAGDPWRRVEAVIIIEVIDYH